MATLSYRDAVGNALQDSMRDEPRLIIIGQNLTGHALKQLAETYGAERVRDCSISKSAMVGMAVGAAMKGMKVVVMIAYADIASVCHMAIVRSAAKLHYLTNGRLNCPVIIRLPIARFRGHGPEGNEVGVAWFYNVTELNMRCLDRRAKPIGIFVRLYSGPRRHCFSRTDQFTCGLVI